MICGYENGIGGRRGRAWAERVMPRALKRSVIQPVYRRRVAEPKPSVLCWPLSIEHSVLFLCSPQIGT